MSLSKVKTGVSSAIFESSVSPLLVGMVCACASDWVAYGRRCVMKLYSKPLFTTTVVVIGMNILIQAYLQDFGEVVAWSLLMLAEFRMKNLEKSLDDSIEREDCWYRIATGNQLKRKEKRDGER
jgi:hypothetical protein